MATLGDRNIFQVSRDKVEKEINQIIQSLNRKKTELMTEINSLETEHNNARKQKQNDVLKLTDLKTQTEELGQNNLIKIQNNLLGEIQTGIDKLNLEFNAPPDFEIKIEWGDFRERFRAILDIPKIVKVIDENENIIVLSDVGDNKSEGFHIPLIKSSDDEIFKSEIVMIPPAESEVLNRRRTKPFRGRSDIQPSYYHPQTNIQVIPQRRYLSDEPPTFPPLDGFINPSLKYSQPPKQSIKYSRQTREESSQGTFSGRSRAVSRKSRKKPDDYSYY